MISPIWQDQKCNSPVALLATLSQGLLDVALKVSDKAVEFWTKALSRHIIKNGWETKECHFANGRFEPLAHHSCMGTAQVAAGPQPVSGCTHSNTRSQFTTPHVYFTKVPNHDVPVHLFRISRIGTEQHYKMAVMGNT